MSYLALALSSAKCEREKSEKSEKSHAAGEYSDVQATYAWDISHISLFSHSHLAERSRTAPCLAEVPLDPAGDPCAPCPACHGLAFHQPPGEGWRCSGCELPRLPERAGALAGWAFCRLPGDEVARLLAAGRRAVAGAVGTSDEGDILTAEEAGHADPA
jgi:hypothetical protein